LWRSDILRQLRWKTGAQILKHIDFQKPKEYRAPSWSWASIDGKIDFLSSRPSSIAAFVDCTVQLWSENDPFGRVKGGTLVLEGRLKESEVRWQGADSIPQLFGSDESFVGDIWLDIDERNATEEIRVEWRELKPWCLQMSADISMLLLPVTEPGSDKFQRVGIVFVGNKDWFQGTPRRTVSII
jgi:hypothetical protein